MQGVYVQLTRGKERTDLYLTVGPEPLGDQDSHGHPRGEPVEPERLLGRVMTRDGSKTLAADTPVLLDVRRWSTRRLREERDQPTALRRECPPDRSWELRLARQRAADLEQVRQAARAEHQAATARLAAVGGSRLRRREAAAARERLTLAEHGLRTTTRQAAQAAERVGRLRRAEQERAGWHEQHADLPQREGAVARKLAWRHRVDARAVALDPPSWLLAELGPALERPAERDAWITAAVELDTWRRTHSLDDTGPAQQERGQHTRPERAGRPVDGLGQRRPASDPLRTSPARPRSHGTTDRAGATPPRNATERHAARGLPSCLAPSRAGASPAGAATGSRSAPHSSAWPPTANAPGTATTAAPSAPQPHTSARSGSTRPAGRSPPCTTPAPSTPTTSTTTRSWARPSMRGPG